MARFLDILILLLTLIASVPTMKGADPDPLLRTGWLFTSPDAVAASYTSFCQAPDGYLWVGTDRGLIRFDGNSYDIYTPDPNNPRSISDGRIRSLLCDSKGRVWAGTANGLNLYDPATDSFDVMKLPQLSYEGYIISVDEQADGTVTFIVSGQGLYVISEGSGSPEAVRYLPNIYQEKNYNALACPPNGLIYASTDQGELCAIRPNGQISTFRISDDYIQDITMEEDGNILVADFSHIYRFDKSTHAVTTLRCDRNIGINGFSDRRGSEIYVATAGEGLWRVTSGSDVVLPCDDFYSPFLNLHSANVGAAYCSPDGNLWMGCNYYGLVMVPALPLPFLYRKMSDTFHDFSGGINAVAAWRGNQLVSLDKGRIAMFAPDGRVLLEKTVPGGGTVCSMLVAGDDKALLGVVNDGIWQLSLPDGNLTRILAVEGKYPRINMTPGLDNELFIAVHGIGVMRYDTLTKEKSWLKIDGNSDRLTNPFVASMATAPDGKVWMGLYGGLACFDLRGDSLVSIDQHPFLPGTSYAVKPLPDNTVLVGTSHGLIHFAPGQGVMAKYTVADGLSDNDVRAVTVDSKGGQWIGTMHGLSYRDPKTGKIVAYHGGYGMVESSCRALDYSPERNRVHMAGLLGLTTFSPDAALTPGFNTKVKVSGIYMNGKRLSPSTAFGSRRLLDGDPLSPSSLHLPYQENAMTLRLSTMDFRDASNVQYGWKVDGLGDEWTETGPGESLVYLPHLDPGKYVLHLQALENGVASEPMQIAIHISAPWYLSWWAKAIYWAVLLSLCMLAFMVWKKRRYEHEAEERIKFFMDVSHDIRSPITLILSPLESLMKRPFDDDVKAKLQIMNRNARRILSLVNQLLEIRKLEKGKMHLRCRLTDLNEFVSELVDMFKPQAEEKGIRLEFFRGENVPEVWVDRSNFDKILVNLISNAIKYTPEGGQVTVNVKDMLLTEGDEWVEVNVIDTGIGLDPKTEGRLFERFYQGDGGNSKGGFGIGLDLCRRLVDFHHGRITGHNRQDGVKGSVFSVMLPVDSSCYAADELILDNTGGESLNRYVILPTAASEETRKARPSYSGKTRTMLVVDDDKELRDYICQHFSSRYKVTGVADGAEALRAIASNPPDIVVSDVMMPGVDGLTLLRRLKSHADTHHIPVVLLSSKQDVADRLAGWDRGADGYLGKPFHVDELEILVDTLIDNRLRIKGKFSGAQETEAQGVPEDIRTGDSALIAKMIKIIENSIEDQGFNVETLSSKMGLSRAHLHRKMKEHVGMTPSDFIRTVRMRRACELLQDKDVPITLVAYKVGFTSQPHFSTLFKNFTGYTPSEYRAKCEEGTAPAGPSVPGSQSAPPAD